MTPFAGFWMGGFEGADHVNAAGVALDMAALSGHGQRLDEDHRRARDAGLACIRESIGWRLCEAPGGRIDLSRALRIADSAARHGLQVLWTVMHYGLPADLSLHEDTMIGRLARFAGACAQALGPAVYTPVNEIGFLAWCASQPGFFAPPNAAPAGDAVHSRISGWAVKRRLARAAIAAVQAMRAAAPGARFLHVEPLVHVVARAPAQADEAQRIAGWQWQAWDLLAGRLEPALGGAPAVLDLLGVNHYHSSQWELGSEARLDWWGRDPRWRPLSALLAEAWARYARPLVIAETSHVGIGRADWLHEVAHEARQAQRQGVPVQGLCLYPLTDRPDWHRPAQWHKSGLWHVDPATRSRHAEPALRRALHAWQHGWAAAPRPDVLLMFTHRRWRGQPSRARPLAEALVDRGWRVLVVEPAQPGAARLDRLPAGPHLDVLVPPGAPGDADADGDGDGDGALARWLAAEGIGRWQAWASTPAGAARAARLGAVRTITDDRVALPAAVDARAFARRRARGWDHEEAQRLQPAGTPRAGWVGPVDPRLDLGLVAQLADARPGWQFVFAGSLDGVDAAALPRRANLHWLGELPPRLLPALMDGWQLLLLPLAAGAPASVQVLLEAAAAGLPVAGPAAGAQALLRAAEQALAAPRVRRRPWRGPSWAEAAARVDALLRA